MKIEIDVNESYQEVTVQIKTPRITQELEKMISMMRMIDMQLAVKKDDETHLLAVDQIVAIETMERNTFVYTETMTYQSDLKLYEIEQTLAQQGFVRISKQNIINLRKIKSLRADIDRKIRITMINGEQYIASRIYADELRKRLGVK